jgi:membrane-associated phospholipid phosphatase
MGSAPFHNCLIISVMLGVSFRRGFFLGQMVVLTSLLTGFLKNLLALPRPTEVDPAIRLLDLDYIKPSAPGTGAKGLAQSLFRQVFDFFGGSRGLSYGFPSGHASTTTSMWGGASLLFKNRWVRATAIPLIAMVAVSRMYLGRHFLADVIGGFILGSVVTLAIFRLFLRAPEQFSAFEVNARNLVSSAYLLLAPFLLLAFESKFDAKDAGRLLGLNASFLLVWLRGVPTDSGPLWRRAARVSIGLLIFLATQFAFSLAINPAPGEEKPWLQLAQGAIPIFISIWLSVEIGKKLRLWSEEM